MLYPQAGHTSYNRLQSGIEWGKFAGRYQHYNHYATSPTKFMKHTRICNKVKLMNASQST